MGGVVAPRFQSWSRGYEIKAEGWQQNIQLALGPSGKSLVFVNELHFLHELPKSHPHRDLCGVKLGRLIEEDIWYLLAELERPLKPVRHWIFFKKYLPHVRVVFPSDARSGHQIGIVIADLAEQKKLSALFREALALVENPS